MRNAKTVATALSLALVTSAFGSGYNVYEQGAKATGQGDAFAARADDASAIFYNPAGILDLERMNLALGATAILVGDTQFTSKATGQRYDEEDNLVVPPQIYFTQRLSPRLAWGAGVFASWGLKKDWGPEFEGRFLARLSELESFTVNPNVAFELGGGWSGAAGIDYSRASVTLTKNISFGPLGEGSSSVDGDGDGWGMNLALRYRAKGPFRWGLSWRSRQTIDVEDADARFQDVPVLINAACGATACFPDGSASASLIFPENAAMGFAWVHDRLEFETDVTWVRWSRFRTLEIDIEQNTALLSDVAIEQLWRDSFALRMGLGWRPVERHEFRFGYYFDRNPIPDETLSPTLPDSNRNSFHVGYGYSRGTWKIDASVQEAFFSDNSTNDQQSGLNGLYETKAILLGVSTQWRF